MSIYIMRVKIKKKPTILFLMIVLLKMKTIIK